MLRKASILPAFILALGLSLSLTFAVPAFAQDYVPGEIIVKLKGKVGSTASGKALSKMRAKMTLKASYGRLNMHKMGLQKGEDLQAKINELKADPDVEYVEPNYILKKFDDMQTDNRVVPFAEAVGMSDADNGAHGAYIQNNSDVGIPYVWSTMKNLSTNPEKPIVAVIDTGVDYTHRVFTRAAAIWTNPGEIPGNGIDDDGNGFVDDVRGWNFAYDNNNPMDDDGHGTHVAGIVLGVGQDIYASSPEEAKIRIMPLKFLSANGSGATSDAISAIYYAVNNGAQVINNSWGGGSYSRALLDALTYAYNNHVTLVAAAGNYNSNNDATPMYPANYAVPGLISVAASTDWDDKASFSNYGVNTVHIAAPGVAILSAKTNYPNLANPSHPSVFMSGTSMASPFVAGLAALALREAPELSGYQVKNLLMNSSEVISGLQPKVFNGFRVNAEASIVNAKGEATTQSFQPEFIPTGSDRSPASVHSGGCGLVSSVVAKSVMGRGGPGDGPTQSPGVGIILALSLLPLVLWQVMRTRDASGRSRRKYDRYMMDSEIKVMVGGRELVGHMKTISVGGLSFEADAMLERGGVVTMNITGPDGKEQVQVEGHIVWNEKNHSYGVQFDHARDTVLSRISNWTKKLQQSA